MKIGKIEWKIKVVNSSSPILEGCDGMCVYRDTTLYISDYIKDEILRETIVHELTHALLAESGFNPKCKEAFGSYYEIFIDNLSKVIDDVIDFDKLATEIKPPI